MGGRQLLPGVGREASHRMRSRPMTIEQATAVPLSCCKYDFWRTRYDGRQDVLGSTIRLNGTPFTVVGVAGAGLRGH